MEPKKLHSRQINIDSYQVSEDRLLIVARLDDQLYQSYPTLVEGDVETGQVHDLALEIEVCLSDLTIVAARASVDEAPFDECCDVIPATQELVGLNIARGFTDAVRQRLNGGRWCVHLRSLVLAAAPAILQAMAALGEQVPLETRIEFTLSQVVNTCLVWREGGPLHRKLEALRDGLAVKQL